MELAGHITKNRYLAKCVCQRLNEEINKLGFAATEINRHPHYDDASYELIRDPYTGTNNLTCYWYDAHNKQRIGRLQFNSDDTFYAEYDLAKTHPSKPQYFVEGVTAWGNAKTIKAEAKLLPIPQ